MWMGISFLWNFIWMILVNHRLFGLLFLIRRNYVAFRDGLAAFLMSLRLGASINWIENRQLQCFGEDLCLEEQTRIKRSARLIEKLVFLGKKDLKTSWKILRVFSNVNGFWPCIILSKLSSLHQLQLKLLNIISQLIFTVTHLPIVKL